MSSVRFLRPLKHAILGRGPALRRILFGAARGLRMTIDPAAKTQRILGLDEREIQATFVSYARWAEVLVDVGASDAYYSLVFRRHNPAGEIHLIDGNVDFQSQQRDHFELNFPGEQNAHFHTRFVGAPDPPDTQGFGLARDLPLLGRRLFLKVDVDGWELDVLRSAEPLFSTTPVRLIIETHSLELENRCIELLRSHGFATRVIPNARWRRWIPELRPPHNRWIAAESASP